MMVEYVVPALIGFGVTCTAALIFALIMFIGRHGCKCLHWCKRRRDPELLGTCTKGHYNSTNPICSNETCPVCLDDFRRWENIAVTPCVHGFHKGCLLQCLRTSPDCPLCKAKVFSDISEYTSLLFCGTPHYS